MFPKCFVPTRIEQEASYTRVVAKPLIAVMVRGLDALDFHITVPIGGRRDCTRVSAEAD